MRRLQVGSRVLRRLRPVLEWLEVRTLLDGMGMTTMLEAPTAEPTTAVPVEAKHSAPKEESVDPKAHSDQASTADASGTQANDSNHTQKSVLDAMLFGGDLHHLVASMNSVLDFELGTSWTTPGNHPVHSAASSTPGAKPGMSMTMEHREQFTTAAMSPFGHGGDIPPEARVWHKPG